MRKKYPVVLLMTRLLFRLSGLAIACCEGDPPGNPICYKCEDGVWVIAPYAQCGQDSDCTGECHSGCSSCLCQGDQSKCTLECHTCWPFLGKCNDDNSKCPGECDYCENGECVDLDGLCTGCERCNAGTCEDYDDKCFGCKSCENTECVLDNDNCPGCQKCIEPGSCEDDNSQCNAANCETCINAECKKCGGDLNKVCCPDEMCYDECQNTPPTGHCDTSYNEDYKCIGCRPWPSEGPSCEGYTTKVYTGNVNHGCTGGCPGDCELKPNVHCYTEYKCKTGNLLEEYGCIVFGNGELGCAPLPFVLCVPCARDPEDPGEKSYVNHSACK